MSRGPGRWQRAILDALEQHGAVWMRDLLPPEAPCAYQWEQLAAQRARRAQYSALHRAACRLCDAGRIEMAFRIPYEAWATTTAAPCWCRQARQCPTPRRYPG
jgi:hypothetical protein